MSVTKTKLAYCDQCNPKVAIGWGALREATPVKHLVGGKIHDGKLLDMDSNETMNPVETTDEFLARMAKKYLKT